MGIIRLTLITLVLLAGAMLYWGRDEGLPDNRLGREQAATAPSTAPTQAETVPIAEAPAPEPVVVEPTPTPATATPEPAPDTTPEPVAAAPEPSPAETALDAAVSEALATPEPPADPEPVVVAPAPTVEPTAPAATEAATEAAATPQVLYVTGSRVNVRSGPATSYTAIDSLTRGTPVEDQGDAGAGWRRIGLPSGETGYMSGDFLSATAP